ncbi:MAG TPA: arsinothricin resistance N-acetyltransferase ArsN1 family B [Gemmatimonadaceae bacterium]|nr:arsinothricin resistance N-acetyltransferase ArsN1 family B [Gemmatimonadaceae bacterium]
MIRLAAPTDAAAIAEIYRPAVMDRATSFEVDPPDASEMARRIESCVARFPWLVAEEEGKVIGYAYASAHRSRAAYQWSVDVSAYVSGEAHRRGIGRSLYEALFRILALQGFRNAYAGITMPNAASEGFHRALGFTVVGVYRGVGYKLGRWHDVLWLERALVPRDGTPPIPTIDLALLSRSPLLDTAIAGGSTPRFRLATDADVPAIRRLIEASVRGLSEPLYSRQQIDSAIRYLLGPDSQLIADGTYYLAEAGGDVIASGGWSRRQTLHGGDQFKHGDDAFVDPARDPARLRAFFVDPRWARRGIGGLMFHICSTAARAAGFRELELTATLPGEQLYATLGFVVVERGAVAMPDGVALETALMRRSLVATPSESR